MQYSNAFQCLTSARLVPNSCILRRVDFILNFLLVQTPTLFTLRVNQIFGSTTACCWLRLEGSRGWKPKWSGVFSGKIKKTCFLRMASYKSLCLRYFFLTFLRQQNIQERWCTWEYLLNTYMTKVICFLCQDNSGPWHYSNNICPL